MIEGKFELSNDNTIRIIGTSFDLNSLKSLNHILQKIIHDKNIKKININGNFNTKLQLDSIFNNTSKIDESLSLLYGITQTIEQSNIIFVAHVKGIMKGLALELALS